MRRTLLIAMTVAGIGGITAAGLAGTAIAAPAADATPTTAVPDAPPAPPPGGPWGHHPWMHGPMGGPGGGPDGHGPMGGRPGGGMFGPGTFALLAHPHDRALSGPDVQKIAEGFLLMHGNHTWKVTEVKEEDANRVSFALASPSGDVIARFSMDRHSGHLHRLG